MAFNHFPMGHARSATAFDGFGRLGARTPARHRARIEFGRRRPRLLNEIREQSWSLPDDLKLFAATFAAGFLFVSILIA